MPCNPARKITILKPRFFQMLTRITTGMAQSGSRSQPVTGTPMRMEPVSQEADVGVEQEAPYHRDDGEGADDRQKEGGTQETTPRQLAVQGQSQCQRHHHADGHGDTV